MKRSNLHCIAPSSELLYSSFEFANCIYQKCNSSNCKICLSTSPLQVSCSAVHALEFARNISSNCICICPKYNMYLSLYQNVFVPVTKYICPLQLGCSAVHGLEFAKTSFGSRRPCKGRQSTPAGRQEKASWKDPMCQFILGLRNHPLDLTKKNFLTVISTYFELLVPKVLYTLPHPEISNPSCPLIAFGTTSI